MKGRGDKTYGEQQQGDVEAELVEFVSHLTPSEGEEQVEEREVDARKEHGGGQDVLLQMGNRGYAVTVDRESSRRNVGESEVDGVPHLHATEPKEYDKDEGEGKIDAKGAAYCSYRAQRGMAAVVGS